MAIKSRQHEDRDKENSPELGIIGEMCHVFKQQSFCE